MLVSSPVLPEYSGPRERACAFPAPRQSGWAPVFSVAKLAQDLPPGKRAGECFFFFLSKLPLPPKSIINPQNQRYLKYNIFILAFFSSQICYFERGSCGCFVQLTALIQGPG